MVYIFWNLHKHMRIQQRPWDASRQAGQPAPESSPKNLVFAQNCQFSMSLCLRLRFRLGCITCEYIWSSLDYLLFSICKNCCVLICARPVFFMCFFVVEGSVVLLSRTRTINSTNPNQKNKYKRKSQTTQHKWNKNKRKSQSNPTNANPFRSHDASKSSTSILANPFLL